MQIPVFQQLTGLLAFLRDGLRADTQLTGDGSGQYNWKPDQVCKTVYPHQMFITAQDGIKPLVNLGKVQAPALAIYVEGGEFADVKSSGSGTTSPVGMRCKLGLQYLFQPRAKDVDGKAFSAFFAMTIWWKICEVLGADFVAASSTLRDTYHIEELGLGSYNLLPPFTQALRAFEADLDMDFKRPPWDTGANSDLINSTLASIVAEITETGDTGADPLMTHKWSQ